MRGYSFEVHAGEGDDTVNQGNGNVVAYGEEGDDLLFTGDGDDVLDGGPGGDQFRGAGGDDRIAGGPGYDTAWGGQGADTIDGGDDGDWLYGRDESWDGGTDDAGNVVLGGAGDDTVAGGDGPDELAGGPGRDTVTYLARRAAVTVTLDGAGPDGAPGEGDAVAADVEDAEGGWGDDVLVGGTDANWLRGGHGADRLEGGRGADHLNGEHGADELDGGDGADVVAGGVGPDSLTGGAGADVLAGEEQDDRIDARDGAADSGEVHCGTGRDVALLDRADAQAQCERREYPDGVEDDGEPPGVAGSWSAPWELVPPGVGAWASGLVVTPGGDAVASWSENVDDETFGFPVRVATAAPGAEPEIAELDAEGGGGGAQLAEDGSGRAYAVWTGTRGQVWLAERPPGGSFGPPQEVGDAGYAPTLAVNRRGDVALVQYSWQARTWNARVRLAEGEWRDVPLSGPLPAGAPWTWTAVLTERREIVALWLHEIPDQEDWSILSVAKGLDGGPAPVVAHAVAAHGYGDVELAADADGRVVAAWTRHDGVNCCRGSAAERPAGAAFGAPHDLPTGEGGASSLQLGVAGDGRITLAMTSGCDALVLSGPAVWALTPVARQQHRLCGASAALGQSPGGRVVAAFDADGRHWRTWMRSGDEPFGPVQDLRRDCGHVAYAQLATDDEGRAAALVSGPDGISLLRHAPFSGEGLQGCLASSPDVPLHPTGDPPGGGPPAAGPAPPALAPAVLGMRVRRSGRGRVAAVRVRCARRCSVAATARLVAGRRTIARTRRALRRPAGTHVVRLRLRPRTAAAARTARRRALRIRARITVRDASGAVARRALSRRIARPR